jgi:methionyl-tRNA synthetase
MIKTFYITTTLPYVNAEPHVGHALEFIRADVAARYKKLLGYDVFFNTGTDEHGQKLFDAAKKLGMDPQEYVDKNAELFKKLLPALGISSDVHFIRTTDANHIIAAQELWKRVANNGYIYKKQYQSKYCVGCELEKTDSELVDGKCPDHPDMEIQLVNEENYFFKFSAFQEKLLYLYKSRPDFVLPDFRLNEIRSFVAHGLDDFSISRLKSKMSWGIPVPGDNDHVMYVWFDALTNYIATLGWPENIIQFEKYWLNGTPTQYCGQDNLRQQSAMWQVMLMAADLPNSYQIIVNGFVTGAGGIKMSKSIGNVIDPIQLVNYYGTESLRYYVLRHIHPWNGSPITYESFHEAYTSNLVNGLGNTASRILTMTEKYIHQNFDITDINYDESWLQAMDNFRFDLSCDIIWAKLAKLDQEISVTKPFKLIKTDKEQAIKLLMIYVNELIIIGKMLAPLLPITSSKILEAIKNNKKPNNLFERKEIIRF